MLLLSGSISDQGLGMDAVKDPLFVNEESIMCCTRVQNHSCAQVECPRREKQMQDEDSMA